MNNKKLNNLHRARRRMGKDGQLKLMYKLQDGMISPSVIIFWTYKIRAEYKRRGKQIWN